MFIKNVLEEEVPGSEYFCENFILVFHKSEFVGGIAAWIEGNGNQSSNFVKAPLLSYYLGIEKWIKVQTDLELLTSIMHQRQAGTLQIDAGYINPKFQGNSIPKVMISYGINFFENEFEKLKKVQVVTIVENVKGLKSLEKLGFKIANKKQSNNQKLIGLISGTGFYQLELDLIKYKNAKYGQK
jgi:ribosomal protein S18 acetylase RimI-like enzyme